MTIWLDNQLPPALGSWAQEHLGVDCTSVRELALQRASDLTSSMRLVLLARW